MHISEGVLSAPVLVAGAVVTTVGVAVGLKKIDYERVPEVALMASAFFIASLVHVPIGPSSAHLVLNGLCGLILGWAAFPAIFVGLLLQAILFQYGGLTALGVNTAIMALPAVALGYACRRGVIGVNPALRTVAAFVCGMGAVLLAGLLAAASLVATGEAFINAAGLIVLAHIPVMIVEGIVTVFIAEFIRRIRPEVMGAPSEA